MALKSTVFKAELQVSDLDRAYFAEHALTLARHPSETDERMMVRMLAFALFASERLAFGRGLSSEDEAALAETDLTGAFVRWIDVGQPDERLIRRACGRSREVVILAYGGRQAEIWWQQTADKVAGLKNLLVLAIAPQSAQALAGLVGRGMKLACTVQEGMVWMANEQISVELAIETWKSPQTV